MLTSPVLELQKKAGATVGEVYGWSLPATYSSLEEEYQAATQGVGLVDRSYVGRLKLTGEDGLDLLDRLSTNKLDELTASGQSMGTVLTTNKGRILDLLLVLRLDDHLLVLTGAEARRKVAEWIDFYTIMEDLEVRDLTEETALLAVTGPEAANLLDELTRQPVSLLARFDSMPASIGDDDVLVIRTDFAGLPGYDLVVSASHAEHLWNDVLTAGQSLGVRPVGMEALELVRLERGVPLYGAELSEDFNPLEANLKEFISFNKGCYIGQEVVARLDTYEKVQRHLVGLSWELDEDVAANADLSSEGKRVGRLTSVARSLRLSRGIGLGYVRKAQARPGVRLTIESPDGEITVQVEELPFPSL